MTECQRCGRDTDRRTLVDELLCPEHRLVEEHEKTRDAGQQALSVFEE